MACFTVPLAEAIVVSVVKSVALKKKIMQMKKFKLFAQMQ